MKLYDVTTDKLWIKLISKYNINVDRQLTVYTYGTVFIVNPLDDLNIKKCQMLYDARQLRSKMHGSYKLLKTFRGTHLGLQEDIRSIPEFESFIINIVSDIEQQNLHTIAIFCRAGHHRSVACAELLKNIYTNIKLNHLTIN